MRLLYFQWNSFMNEGMTRALGRLGISCGTYCYQFRDWERDDDFLETFTAYIKESSYDTVFSINFSPLISQVCEETNRRYISWVYDSPIHIRQTESLKRQCNEIWFFDRGQAQIYQKQGICAGHLPLAADPAVFAEKIGAGGEQAQISFVGQLYRTEYAYFASPLSPFYCGYLEGIINAQAKVSGGYLIPELVTEELLDGMNRIYQDIAADGFQMGRRELEYMLACETTGRERYLALALLSNHFALDWYAGEADDRLENVRWRGYANYYNRMPDIFAHSKINLNISLKSIRTGIPLRVLDIMGCGGFVLTNYQEELMDYFVPGEECVIYDNIGDLYEKAAYYLSHETERRQIAEAGFERIRRDFTFESRIKVLFGEQ